jgi:hypothetical protein
MTYPAIWRKLRSARGSYPRTPRGVVELYVDLARPVVRLVTLSGIPTLPRGEFA